MMWNEVNQGNVSLAHLNEAPIRQRLVAEGAHLKVGGKRTRIWGINICSDATMPDHETAEITARRLASFGFNAVRFHHMEADWTDRTIFGRTPLKQTRILDPQEVDRIDYFVSQLKKQGIYTNMNLLVSRTFKVGDGLPPEIETVDWKKQATIGMFDRQLIALQKEYAKNLLGRVNPYTRLAYKDDPALAFVEINNENSLLQAYFDGWLPSFPERYVKQLRGHWTQYLKRKYTSGSQLTEAWSAAPEPEGPEMLSPAQSGRKWVSNAQLGSQGDLTFADRLLRFAIRKDGGDDWTAEVMHAGLSVKQRRLYTLAFEGKADRQRPVRVTVSRNGEPWNPYGLEKMITLSTEWTRHEFTFVATMDSDNARLVFANLAQEGAEFEFRNVSLRPGGSLPRPEGLDLNGEIPLIGEAALRDASLAAKKEFVAFLRELEAAYWREMANYLRRDLGIRAIIVPTIVGVSSPHLMSTYPVVDSHGYWAAPSGEFWAENWSMEPRSMVHSPRESWVSHMAARRVFGKPFMVSEYNHAHPNLYASEAPLFAAIYGSLQDWDGLWHFDYSGSAAGLKAGAIVNPFSAASHPGQMMHCASAAAAFRTFALPPAKEKIWRTMDVAKEVELLATVGSPWNNVNARSLGLDPLDTLRHQTGIRLQGAEADPAGGKETGSLAQADHGGTAWAFGVSPWVKAAGRASAFYIGSEAEFTVGDVRFRQAWSPRWVSLSMAETTKGRQTLVLVGTVANQGMVFNEFRTSTGRRWGASPTLVQSVPGVLTLAAGSRLYELNSSGTRVQEIIGTRTATGSTFALDGRRGVWFEVTR